MRHSIRKQVAFPFIGLLLFVLIANYLINNFFLEGYYMVQKEQALVKVYQLINSYRIPSAYSSDEFLEKMEYICGRNNIHFVISDGDLNPQVIYAGSKDEQALMAGRLFAYAYGVDQSEKDVLAEKENYTIQRIKDPYNRQDYLEVWGKLDNGYYFIMRVIIDSIRESVSISNEFFAYFALLSLLLGIVIVVLVSKRITKPVQELTHLSKRMAELDFDAKYTRGGDDEIAQMGEHFNRMSDKLQEVISELKTANNELLQDIEKKEQIDEMRKDFLSNVSHELKTPIALIQGYAEGLKECINDDPESREFYCDVIMDEAAKMNQMVKKLLTLNQLEFGNEVVNLERFDLTNLVQGVLNSASLLAQQKEAEISFWQQEPVYVWADEFKIEEVVTNYVSNALNHVDGEKRIEVRIQREENGCVRTSVFNTGKQIPEADLDKVWIKFYKVDKARTREYGGSGIGLSIVKAIMDSFHQKCGVRNREDGVEFWFELDGGKDGTDGKNHQRLLQNPEQSQRSML